MKTKMMLALMASFFLLGGTAFAFHGGGVAHCDGCHSMHNSADNARKGSATAADLMKGSDDSSTCLNCHDGSTRSNTGYRVMSTTNGSGKSQGGDFFWVKDAATHDLLVRGTPVVFDPDNKGHNIVALDYGYSADAANAAAPGGLMASNEPGCTSCHDPHGQVAAANGLGTPGGAKAISVSGSYGAADPTDGSIHGNYRLLGDVGFKQITAAAPVARANGSDGVRVDYGSGMSAWCLSCHQGFNDNANKHPVNVPVPTVYNNYKKTGDYTGDISTAFDSLVPFERGVTDGSLLTNVGTAEPTLGVDGNSRVMCLSCHRAHASAFDNALRWDDATSEFIAESAILEEHTSQLIANGAVPYYKNGAAIDVVATYGQWQRSLCNKCHAKD